MKVYEGNRDAWGFLIISLTYKPFGLVIQCNNNAHEARKVLIDKYKLSDEKQEIINEVTNKWNNFRIKDTIRDPEICFNELFYLNFKLNRIKEKYDNDED